MGTAWKRCTPALLAIALAIQLASCYTLLKHPETDDQAGSGEFGRCSECHVDYDITHPPYPYYPDPWWDYYLMPWWYDDIIIISDDGEEIPSRRYIHERESQYREDAFGVRPIRRDKELQGDVDAGDKAIDSGSKDKQRDKKVSRERNPRDRETRKRDDADKRNDGDRDRSKSKKDRDKGKERDGGDKRISGMK
jgi:hypothetical protein